jgi:hypothetical protein
VVYGEQVVVAFQIVAQLVVVALQTVTQLVVAKVRSSATPLRHASLAQRPLHLPLRREGVDFCIPSLL